MLNLVQLMKRIPEHGLLYASDDCEIAELTITLTTKRHRLHILEVMHVQMRVKHGQSADAKPPKVNQTWNEWNQRTLRGSKLSLNCLFAGRNND